MPAYIKIPDVTGEVNEQNHQEWVQVNSVSLPISRSIQNGAVGVGRSNGETVLGDIVVSKTWDSSTPSLAAAVANGKYKFSGIDAETVKRNLCQYNKGLANCDKALSAAPAGGALPPGGGCK